MRFPWFRRRISPDDRPKLVQEMVAAFERRSGIRFHDRSVLEQSLTHRSFLGCNGGDPCRSNERLEFLGDAVLELVVIEYLFRAYPLDREGDLTKKKSLLVSKSVLANRAERMGLGGFILLSESERDSGGRERASILADGFEAVVGAIYMDRGISTVRRFIHDQLLSTANTILEDRANMNYKSLLQEYVQARYKTHPRYRVVTEVGPDHMKLFTIEVSVRGELLGRGQGYNKKEAEQSAAGDALARLRDAGLVDAEGNPISSAIASAVQQTSPKAPASAEAGQDERPVI